MFQVSGPEKSAKGKIILIITPARRCSHLCLPYVCLFVCLLVGDRPSPVFSILPCFFYRPAGSITVEYGIRRSIWQIRELLRLPNFLIQTAAAHTLHAKMQSFSAFLFVFICSDVRAFPDFRLRFLLPSAGAEFMELTNARLSDGRQCKCAIRGSWLRFGIRCFPMPHLHIVKIA